MTKDVFIKEVRDAEAMLYHISKSILKNDSDCGDAVQETILKAYEKLPTLKDGALIIRNSFPSMNAKGFFGKEKMLFHMKNIWTI